MSKVEAKKMRDYVLHFMYRNGRSQPTWKIFEFEDNLTAAINEGRRHCEAMDMRFIKVIPFKVDLREQERKRAEDPDLVVENMS